MVVRCGFSPILAAGFNFRTSLCGGGFGQTHRQLEALEAVAGLALSMRADAVRSFMRRVGEERGALGPREGALGLVVLRNHDTTPIRVAFGRLAAELAPHARYFTPAPNGRWKAVDMDEFRCVHQMRGLPSKGTLQLFAQTSSIHYANAGSDERVVWYSHDVLLPPVFLGRNNASCAAEAMARTPFNMAALLQLVKAYK